MTESTIDFPKESLCLDVWEKVMSVDGMSEIWRMIPAVKQQILDVATALMGRVGIEQFKINITGSITSNSYTENADIDVHFNAGDQSKLSDEESDALNKQLREAFQQMKDEDESQFFVAKHPFEVYWQNNVLQDLMSVGCYDLFDDVWVVGPELQDQSFNPYSEYYAEIQQKAQGLASQIRDLILSTYEVAVVICKNVGHESGVLKQMQNQLVEKLAAAQQLYDNIRNMRKVYSSPTSAEQAAEYRTSRKWKIADAAFKLFDKYGYMAILKEFVELNKLMSASNDIAEEAANEVLTIVKKYINNADKLSEKDMIDSRELQVDEAEQVNEGTISNMLLATLLAIPGILPAAQVKKSMDTQPSYNYIVNDINAKCKKFGQYTAFQAANIIARTLYAEARNDGAEGMTAVASVIYERANGNAADFANVCKKHGYSKKAKKVVHQFSCWNKMTDSEWDPNSFNVKLPATVKKGSAEQKRWEKAMEIAAEMLAGKFKPTIKANMYYNDKTASPDWGPQLTNVVRVGKHKFGTLKNHSAFI